MQAIVLARRDFREYDQIISVYTKEKGKVEALARGIKKILSKNAAHVEPCSFVHLEIIPGREIDHVTTVVSIDPFSQIRSDIHKSIAAGVVVSLTNILVHAGQPEAKIFHGLLGWLKFVEKNVRIMPILVDGYSILLLHSLGFTPVTDHCVVCGKQWRQMVAEKLETGVDSGFYFAGGGIICHSCRVVKEQMNEKIVDCGFKEASGLALLLKGDWGKINAFPFDEDEALQLHELVYEFTVFHSEKKIEDWKRVLSL